jgi:hypothetical protein
VAECKRCDAFFPLGRFKSTWIGPAIGRIMPSDIDLDPPISHAIADGWAEFAEMVLPLSVALSTLERIAYHFDVMYVLQIAQQVIEDRPGEEVSLAACWVQSSTSS